LKLLIGVSEANEGINQQFEHQVIFLTEDFNVLSEGFEISRILFILLDHSFDPFSLVYVSLLFVHNVLQASEVYLEKQAGIVVLVHQIEFYNIKVD